MGRGVPCPVMGVLISRAVPRGTSLCFTAEQDNNHSPSPSLSYRGSVFPAGVSPGPWWGCKPGSGGHRPAESHPGHGQAGGTTGGCTGDWELAAHLTTPRGLQHDSPSPGKEQGGPRGCSGWC